MTRVAAMCAGDDRLEELRAYVGKWLESEPLRLLAEESGWRWPRGGLLAVAEELARLSDDWDFRNSRERDEIPTGECVVNGRTLDGGRVLDAADRLGLVRSHDPDKRWDHLVVLSGMVRACMNRSVHAKRLLDGGVRATDVHVLTGFRPLGPMERQHLVSLGLGPAASEHEAALSCTAEAFGASGPAGGVSEPSSMSDDVEQRSMSSIHHLVSSGRPIMVHRCASADPARRRVNTADQMDHLAEVCDLTSADSVLFVTTQIYVPYQRFEAWRRLSIPHGLRIEVCGVDAAGSYMPTRDFGPADYLQEVRSAILSADRLLRQLVPAKGMEEHGGSPGDRGTRL